MRDVPPFSIRLGEFEKFQHSKKSRTIYLDPEVVVATTTSRSADGTLDGSREALNNDILQTLHTHLVSAFPDCTDQYRDGTYTPHLSVGQFGGAQNADRWLRKLQDGWAAEEVVIEFDVGELCVIEREGFDDPFKVTGRVPLCGGGSSGSM